MRLKHAIEAGDEAAEAQSLHDLASGGRLRIVEIAKKPDDVSRVLGERGYARAPPRAPPIAELPVSPHGQLRLVFK